MNAAAVSLYDEALRTGGIPSDISSDRKRVGDLLLGIAPRTLEVHTIIIPGDPPSKARPRFVLGEGRVKRAYTPRKTIEGERRIANFLTDGPQYRGNVALACLFYRASYHRIDVDNLLKAILDGATAADVWEDDSQVTALVGLADYDSKCPRTLVAICPHEGTALKRGDDARVACEACGTLFMPAGKRRETARWCSRECRTILASPVPCEQCGEPFKQKNGNQKFCSNACRYVASKRPNHCRRCGHETPNKRAVLCRDCFRSEARASEPTILRLWNDGVSIREIASELDVSEDLAYSRVRDLRKRGQLGRRK